MSEKYIPEVVIKRLPIYYRYIGQFLEKGEERFSSYQLSVLMKTTASQIRQDLNIFGKFGQNGYGYNVKDIHCKIGKI